jgi:PAS domain S-box-containing protein
MQRLLIIEDDKVDQMAFERFTRNHDFPFEYEIRNSIKDAKEVINSETFDGIISDFYLGDGTAFDILDMISHIPLIVITGTGSEEVAVKALKKGAYDYLIKDVDGYYLTMLSPTIQNAIKRYNAEQKLKNYHKDLEKQVKERTQELKKELEIKSKIQKRLQLLDTAVKQSVNTIIITDKEGNIEFINPRFTQLTGYTKEEVIGQNPRILKSGEQTKEFYQNLWNTISSGNTWHGELHNKTKEGNLFWESTTISPIVDEQGNIVKYMAVKEDISSLKIEQYAHLESENRFKTLFESLGDAIFVTILGGNLAGKILEINKAAMVQTGYSRDELLTKNIITDLTIGNYSTDNKRHWEDKLNHNETITITEKKKRKDGSEYWAEVIVTPILYKGIRCSLSINRDITERKEAEENLIFALEKAQESDRLKTAFLHNISHEIRTPMNAIMGFASLLNDPNLTSEEIHYYVDIINSGGNRMLNTLNNLMTISLLETGNVKLDIKNVNFTNEVKNLYAFFQLEAKNKGLEYIFEQVYNNEPIQINTDQEKLFAVMSNLVKNAIKYTHHGYINIGYKVYNEFLEFYVKDSGIGIPKDRQIAIFERFVQADIEDREVYEGNGLGLSISKSYVEMLGGELYVDSEEKKGSTFTLKLPIKYNDSKIIENKKPKMNTKMKLENLNRTLNVLIVEDDTVSELYLRSVLMPYKCKLTVAKNGKEAIDAFKQNPSFDFILMDLRMPKLDGYSATREIRKMDKDVTIIAQTAYALSGDKEKAMEAGCDYYITKPIDKNEFLELLNAII